MSTSFFVAADWLAEHIDDQEIQIIDARMAPAGQESLRDMDAEYRAGHIPNAVFFDIEALSDRTSPLPHMMPRAEAFAVAMRELGVSPKHRNSLTNALARCQTRDYRAQLAAACFAHVMARGDVSLLLGGVNVS